MVHDFYEVQAYNVQVLDTMRYLKKTEGMVRQNLCEILHMERNVRNDKDCKEWYFVDLVIPQKEWTKKKVPVYQPPTKEDDRDQKRERILPANQKLW